MAGARWRMKPTCPIGQPTCPAIRIIIVVPSFCYIKLVFIAVHSTLDHELDKTWSSAGLIAIIGEVKAGSKGPS